MKKIWTSLSNIGVQSFVSPDDRQRIRLLNQLLILSILTVCSDLIVTARVNAITLWAVNVPTLLGLLLNFRVHRLGSRFFSVIYFALIVSTQIFLLNEFYLEKISLGYFYLPLALVLSLMYRADEPFSILTTASIPLGLWGLTSELDIIWEESMRLTESDLAAANAGNIANTIIAVTVFLYGLLNYRDTFDDELSKHKITLQSIIENTPDAVWSINDRYELLAFNQTFARNFEQLVGHPPVKGQPVFQEDHEEIWQKWKVLYDRALQGEQFYEELHFRLRDGSLVIGELSFAPIRKGDICVGVNIFGRDIGERVRFEEDLRRRQQEWEELTLAVPGVVYQIRGDVLHQRRFMYISPKVKEVLGISPEHVLSGRFALDHAVIPEDRERARLAEIKALQSGRELAEELRMNTPWGVRWMFVRSSPMGDSLKTWTGLILDIHERKLQEQEINRTKELLESINRNINEGLFRWSSRKGLVYCNDAAARIFGFKDARDLKENGDMATLIRKEKETELIQSLKERGSIQSREIVLHKSDGSTFTALLSGYAIPAEDKELVVDGSIRDITTIKEYERNLMDARDRAEKASQAKADFLSTMSHEIRTPLNAIIGLSGLLKDMKLKGDQGDYVNSIHFSASTLLALVNDILDYSKIEADRLSFEQVRFNLREFLAEMEKTVIHLAQGKPIRVVFDLASNLPAYIESDPVRLNQVLNNLLSNAIKFTSEGRVELGVKLLDPPALELTVTDTGMGISGDFRDKIFDSFVQDRSKATGKVGGTGLGLTITKKLVEMQGGKLELVSTEEGRGSVFRAVIPVSPVEEGDRTPAGMEINPEALRGKRILVVEDNPVNSLVTSKILEQWGCLVRLAENGRRALEEIEKELPELVLMDLQMPVMDGFEATAEILEKYPDPPPIIALTADALETTRQKVLAHGMLDFVAKPFNKEELKGKILKHIR